MTGIAARAASRVVVAVSLAALVAGAAVGQQGTTAQQLLGADAIPADHRIPYGEHPMQFGDLRIPEGEGPWPMVILIHGGCWQDIADLQYLDRAAEAITAMGAVTWNIEFRPLGVEGGGWPGTFLDVARGVDKLRDVALEYDLGMERVITLGHSSGGHLALWAAGRPRVPEASELYSDDPLPVGGVVSLAGVPELRRFRRLDPSPCGDGIVDRLMGGGPREMPARYLAGSPFQMLPLNVVQRHITGRNDEIVSFRQVGAYNYEAQSAGDDSQLVVVPDANHWDVVWPGTEAWGRVEEVVRALLDL